MAFNTYAKCILILFCVALSSVKAFTVSKTHLENIEDPQAEGLQHDYAGGSCQYMITTTPTKNPWLMPVMVNCTCQTGSIYPAYCPVWRIQSGKDKIRILSNTTVKYSLSCSNLLRFNVTKPYTKASMKIRCDGGSGFAKDFTFTVSSGSWVAPSYVIQLFASALYASFYVNR